MIKKTTIAAVALLAIAFSAVAETVSQETALAVAEGFIRPGGFGARLLPDRSVSSAIAWGNLWIVALEPSGYIEIAGSTKCAPILSFSAQDFAEPEVGSPFAAKLTGDSTMVETKEADDSLEDNPSWAKYTAPVAKKRTLLSAKPTGTDGTGYTPYVAPLLGATWNQTAPFNDLSPYNYFCGCMATAAGQELRYWRWPYRYEKFRQSTHGVRDAQFNYSDFVLRPNGLVPFNWDKVVASAPNPASTPWAADKEATYNTAWLSLWAQSLTGMGYKPGGSGGTRQLAASAEEYWYEKGKGYTYWNDGYEALWAAVKADLDWGSPIQINTAAHQMVIDGYAVENNGTEEEVDWINLNLGYGNAVYWENLKTAVTEGTYSGVLASFQTGFRPQKIVQFEPVPKVIGSSLTLAWHIAPCYTNRISGFFIQASKDGTNAGAGMIPSFGDTTERYTYAATNLVAGSEYTFTVTPLMNEGEGTGRPNSVATTIGTPQPAPEIISVSSVACGIELLQQDIFIECAYGITNRIDLTCSESTTEVVPYSSHLTILPDSKLSVTKVGNVFTVNVDATVMEPKWSGEMLVLTLVAKNADGTEAYKNLMLRFNSMRNVLGGTFEVVETSANSSVWFAGGTTTTLDAKGKAVTFASGAVNGTGTIILTNGSFTFEGLNGFTGTLKWAPSVTVNLPADMSNFAGTLWFEQWGGTYHLARSLGSRAKVYIGGNTQLFIDNNVTVDAAITGGGYIMVVGSAPTFGNLSGFTGHISLGDYENSGTVTIAAGQEKDVVIDNGTVNLVLSREQIAYGYSTTAITMQGWGLVVFKDESGNELKSWNSNQSFYSIVSTANTWTPDEFGTGNFWDAARWSQGLPSAGDYVIFNDNFGDTEMKINLPSDFKLGYVLVTGTKLKISETTGSATLSVDTFRNTAIAAIETLKCAPTTVVPEGKLRLLNGLGISCDVDSSLAGNMKYYYDDTLPAMYFADIWKGTVVFTDYAAANLDLSYWANTSSVVRLNGVAGYLQPDKVFPYTVELVNNGETPALNWSNGSSGAQSTFNKLTGTGTFQTTAGGGNTEKVLIKDISGFTGSFNLAAKNVAIADAMPDDAMGSSGRLYVEKEVEISSSKTWAANGGIYLGADGRLTVNGAFATGSAINTYGAGTVLTIEDGGSVKVNGAISGDNAPTLNFKAGKYQVSQNLRETKTINFCADTGKYTTLDANGNTFTLGPNVFSGSGDVYLTSSKAGGKIVVEGISADYTGTIYCDISCEVSFGDLSKATNCNINVSDVILSRSSSDVGNLTVGLGASLDVTVTKDNQINGCTIDTVTLNDGATMVLKDKTGQVLETFTAEDAVDGKYVLAADPSVTVEYLLDYEFNGNMLSIGTDTTGLNIWNGTASYDSKSEKIYMRCKPYINKMFAMPDDEWSVFMRCTLPAANSEKPTMMLMFGKNGGNVFGLVAGTGENTVALASKDNLIGEAVQISDATTKQHVYAIVKTANRVRLYVDGVLKVDESATVSVSKEFQFGSVKNGNNTSYDPCDDANALIDYMRFYDFAVGQAIIDNEVAEDDDSDPVVDPDATPLEVSEGFVTSEYQLAFKDAALSQLTASTLGGKFSGGWVTNKGKDATFCNFVNGGSTMICEAQIDGEYAENNPIIKAICLEFAQVEDDIYVKATEVKWKANSTLGEALTPVYNPGTLATTESANGYGFYKLSLVRSEEPAYEGPEPVAVWVAGEFGDDRSAHAGLEISLNGNTTNALGQIMIGNSTTLGATISLPAKTYQKVTMLVQYSLPSNGAPVDNSVPASLLGAYEFGARATQGSSSIDGYYLDGTTVKGGYGFSTPAQTIPKDGYILFSTWATDKNPEGHGTAAYTGATINNLSGGEKTNLRATGPNNYITSVGIGGPTVAGAMPWVGMIVKSVALFDEWVTPSDLAGYQFPAQGAVRPVDSDRYTIDPVVSWVNDFKTTTKGDYTLSVSGTTAAKDDTFGGTLTIGDAAAVVDVRNGANGGNLTVLVKYRATPATVNAPVVTFGETLSNSVKIDVGAYTQSARTLAVNRSYNGGNNKWVALNTAASLNEGVGYLLCARKSNDMLVYVGDSLDSMTGGSTAAPGDISYSCDLIQAVGIGGPSGLPNADSAWSPFAGFVVEKVVVFNGYYTPAELTGFNVKAGETKSFAAGEAEEYPTIGKLSSTGTIKIANASELSEGTYKLAEWTTPQRYTTECAGYGKVGTLVTEGLAAGLSARLIYGARAIYLRVDDTAKQVARKPLVILPYGDSITEGFNAQHTGANYRILLYQKLELLGFNVKSAGIYGLDDGYNSVDPTGTALANQYRWHSAKHGAVTGRSTATGSGRGDLEENVDTVCAQAGKPDAVLLHIGINDLVSHDRVDTTDLAKPVYISWSNVVWRLVKDLPETKIVVSTVLYGSGGQATRKITKNDVQIPLTDLINDFNDRIKNSISDFPEGHVFLADLNAYVKSTENGILYDGTHPDWWGYDQMAEGWLSVITNQFSASQSQNFPSATPIVAPTSDKLGAAAKEELADYINGFKRYAVIEGDKNILPTLETAIPYSQVNNDAATTDIKKVGYFVEYVRNDNNVHKWVWVDMDAFGDTIEEVGLPKAKHQCVVSSLHVKSNHGAIDDVPANDDTVKGFVEFSPFDYSAGTSNVEGGPKDYSCYDWNDTLSDSGSKSCMQVHRIISSTSAPGGQVLFAYNNWRSGSSEAEFGIGNFSQHFYGGTKTFDYSETKNIETMNAGAYSVKRIEIWTKEKVTDTDYPTPYSWIDMYFPELVSGWNSTQYNDFATNKNHSSVKNGCAPWESYVLGLDPTNETSKFLATIRMEGQRPVVEYSPTNTTLGNITYVLQGKPALTNGWQNVEFDAPGDTNRFFRVKVSWE